MSRAITMLCVCWVKIALWRVWRGSPRYPEVRNSSAAATRLGVLSRPSRSGSSPISRRISRTKPATLSRSNCDLRLQPLSELVKRLHGAGGEEVGHRAQGLTGIGEDQIRRERQQR